MDRPRRNRPMAHWGIVIYAESSLAMKTDHGSHAHDWDGITEASDAEVSKFIARATQNDQIGAIGVYTDREIAEKHKQYMRDYRERMSTWRAIERQRMGRPSRAFSGERCF